MQYFRQIGVIMVELREAKRNSFCGMGCDGTCCAQAQSWRDTARDLERELAASRAAKAAGAKLVPEVPEDGLDWYGNPVAWVDSGMGGID